MNVKRWLVILITVICVTLNVTGLVLYQKQRQLQKHTQLVEHSYVVITHIEGLYGSIEKMTASQHAYLLNGNASDATHYRAALAEMKTHFNEIKTLTADNPDQQKNLRAFDRLIKQLVPLLQTQMESKPWVIGNLHISLHDDFADVRTLLNSMRALSEKMLHEENELLGSRIESSQSRNENYVTTLLFSSLASIVVILLGNLLLLRLLTRQRDTQDALDTVRERLDVALKGTNDGIIDWPVHGPEIYLSPRFRELLGYSAEELPDQLAAYERIIHPDDLVDLRQYTLHYLTENLPDYRTVFRIRHKTGAWRWHLVRAITIVDKQHKKLRLIGAHTDITEQKTLEERIIATNKELEEFTYITSHDLRAPLINLKGFSGEIEHILKRLATILHPALPHMLPEQQTEILEAIDQDLPQAIGFIKSSVTRMDRLTQAILDLSRLGRRELQFRPLDPQKIVETCLQSFSHQLSEKNMTVMVSFLPLIIADAMSIEQVFGNLIDNAIKYRDPTRPGEIAISARRTATETIFSIADNGRGIAEQDLAKIFEIFKRSGNNQSIEGEGMGLAYIKSILRRHRGKIECISSPGMGSTFSFTIPYRIKQARE